LPSKRPRVRFQDIIRNVEAIDRYTRGLDEKRFVANDLVVDAVERCLSFLRHEYDAIRRNDLWIIVTEDLASLGKACAKAIANLDDK
jgi:uncharacterized protein with HEPN domain